MQLTFLLPIWGVIALVLYKIVTTIITRRQYAAKARELGCQEPPMYPDCGFLGLKHVKYMQAADKNRLFPDLMIEREEHMSKIHGREVSTFKFNVLGQTIYFTSDPENIKAMLATQFPDFYFGPARRGNMIRTLGDGIVSTASSVIL